MLFVCSYVVVQDILRDIEDHDIGSAVSHFLNCFFGNYQAAGGKASAKNQKKVLVYYQSLFYYSFMFVNLELGYCSSLEPSRKVSYEKSHAFCLISLRCETKP